MKKIKSTIVPAKEGTGIWQPGIKGNCTTIKISPWNIEKTQHTVFLHELPNGGEIQEHSHEDNEEIFICLEGEAIFTIDGVEFLFKKNDVAFIAPLSKHRICAVSDFKMMVIISPTGLEDRLKLMGKCKSDLDEIPPNAFDSEIGKINSHGVRR